MILHFHWVKPYDTLRPKSIITTPPETASGPLYDHGDITAILTANLAFEFLTLLAAQKRGG